jgi:hypothetical protein
MNRRAIAIVAATGLAACARAPHTRVVVAYSPISRLDSVTLQAVNATGRDLPMPPPGLIERAVGFITGQPGPTSDIVDAFAQAAAARLAAAGVRIDPSDVAAHRRLRISLTSWDVRNGNSSSGVVFVNADYQLVDERDTILWEVRQDNLPVRLTGPNLSRVEVGHVAGACVDAALESLAGGTKGSGG